MLLCVLGLVFGASATAEEPGTAAISVLPADGRTRGVQIRAQTVDVTISEEAGVVWADTQVLVDFYNPGQTPIVVPVTLPGPQLAPVPLPEQLKATLDNKTLQLTLLPQSNDQPQIQATTAVTVPVRGKAALRISYRQALPMQDGLAVFTYFLTAAANWSGKPESLRVTVRFDSQATPGQVLSFAPAATRTERDGLTWHWENTEPTEDVGVAFIAPAWWADLETARRQTTPEAGLAQHTALAERYWRLATLTPPHFQSEDTFERFFPAAVEALVEGIANPGDAATSAQIAAAHVRLADFYRARAERLAPEAAISYLQLAASEMQAALALQPFDAGTRQTADALHRQLLALARDRGDALAVQGHEARLAAMNTEAALPSEQALAQGAALTLAEQAVARGDNASATQEVASAFGAGATTLPAAPAPRLAQTRIVVTTTPTSRTFSLHASGDGAAGAALLVQASQALAGALPGITLAEAGADFLAFSLPYTDTQHLMAAQSTAAAALADIPELALLVAALKPAQQTWHIERQPFLFSERYVEMVDLRSAHADWEARASQLMAAAGKARAADGAAAGRTIEARLAGVQAALWADDAAAWRALAEHSKVVYRVELSTREWPRTGSWPPARSERSEPARATGAMTAWPGWRAEWRFCWC